VSGGRYLYDMSGNEFEILFDSDALKFYVTPTDANPDAAANYDELFTTYKQARGMREYLRNSKRFDKKQQWK
jgi:hypothetical protein